MLTIRWECIDSLITLFRGNQKGTMKANIVIVKCIWTGIAGLKTTNNKRPN